MHFLRVGTLLSASALMVAGCGGFELVEGDPLDTNSAALSEWGVKVLGPGFSPSLAVDDNGVPAVSVGQGVADPAQNQGDTTPVVYRNDGNWRHEAGWRSEHIGVVPGHLQGSHSSLAFNGSTAQLIFSSRDRSDRFNPMTLKLATKNLTPNWQVSTFADDGWIRQAVQRVTDGTTRVVYPDPTQADHVRIATSGFGGWTTHTLPMPHALLNSLDFAVADTGKPVLGIVTTTLGGGLESGGVHFAGSSDGGAIWGPVVTIDDVWGMIGPQLAFSGDEPMVSYTELDARHAKFAHSVDGGGTWQVETIATFDTNPATGLAVDPKTGEPVVVIAAKDLTANEDRLHIARRDYKGNWSMEIVDTIDLFTGYRIAVNPRIAITEDGTVAVAYEVYNQLGESHIRFAWDDPQPIVVTPPGRN